MVPLSAKACKPGSAASADGGATEQADVSGEGGFQPWLSLFSFDSSQGSLLPANVGASPAVDVDVKVVPGTTSVLADEASGVYFVDSLLEVSCFLIKLAVDVDVGSTGVHSTSCFHLRRRLRRDIVALEL